MTIMQSLLLLVNSFRWARKSHQVINMVIKMLELTLIDNQFRDQMLQSVWLYNFEMVM